METTVAQIIDAKYPLGHSLAATRNQSVYETSYRDQPAIIKIIPVESLEEARRLLAGFSVARELHHPNLIGIYDFGEDFYLDSPVVYVVMERADENLADVLSERTLDAGEAQAVRDGLTPALEFLHAHGYIHGSIKPSNVLACGDTLKLSSDRLKSAGEGSDGPASDFSSLAALTATASGIRQPEPAPELPAYRKRLPLAIGGAVAAALLCVFLIRGVHSSPPPPPVVAPAPVVTAPAAIKPSPVLPGNFIPPGWAVIGAAYHREADAEKRAAKIRAAHPGLRVRVLSPDINDHRSLLVFAAGLSEAEAKRELIRARRAGAPGDSYLSRFR